MIEARPVRKVRPRPSLHHRAIVHGRAVTLAQPFKSLCQLLVQLGTRDVEVGSVNPAMESRAQDRDRVARAIESQQYLSQLVVDPGESVRGGMDRLGQLGGRGTVLLPGNQQHSAQVMVGAAVAPVDAPGTPVLDGVSETPKGERVTR